MNGAHDHSAIDGYQRDARGSLYDLEIVGDQLVAAFPDGAGQEFRENQLTGDHRDASPVDFGRQFGHQLSIRLDTFEQVDIEVGIEVDATAG